MTGDSFEKGMRLALDAQFAFEAKLQDPAKRRAWDLVQEGEALFFKKQYDLGIEKLIEAARLDPDWEPKIDAFRKLKEERLRKGSVKLTQAINRSLMPRLRALGFVIEHAPAGAKWSEGSFLVRPGPSGRTGVAVLGREKFGNSLGLNITRHAGAQAEYLDPARVGLTRDSLKYFNQAEAERVLERVAAAFEGPILEWLDAEGGSDA
jgi:hypothetical protein